LKDSKSQISAVMFRGHNSRLKFKPVDGLEVIIRGRVTVYEPRGNYQITCEMMEPVGAGALQKAYEQLKEKLKNDGLFDPAKKRSLPVMPRHIALVTSPTGAAIRDMLHILSRRNKSVKITLVPTLVQGASAASQIVEALKQAYRLTDLDAVIVGRGGGSVEDMWCFNDEAVARTIAASPVPIISAVGHEIDFTIADFVADVRAPTPSAAAELVVKNTSDLVSKLDSAQRFLVLAIQKHLKTEKQFVQNLNSRLVDPQRRLQDLRLRNDELVVRLQLAANAFFERQKFKIQMNHQRLKKPDQLLSELRNRVNVLGLKLSTQIEIELESSRTQWQQLTSVLGSLSPLQVVERGYSMTKHENRLVKSASQVKAGDLIHIQLMNGEIEAKVIRTIEVSK
jgi:exodeoxyribonuclease VII large subunit